MTDGAKRKAAGAMRTLTVENVLGAAAALLKAAGLTDDQARAVAGNLVEADLLGHRTHGLRMLPVYLDRLASQEMVSAGEIEVLTDHGASFSWRTPRLPGAWVMERLFEEALRRSADHPVVTATLAGCGHVGALQTWMEKPARQGRLGLLMVTDPGVASMAPPGGLDAVTTSNPIAACIPTRGEPVLIDTSTSLVSNSAVASHAAAGRRLGGPWLIDNQGRASDDPTVVTAADPPGTLMPIGGEDFGYKGFAIGLLVEAFALALGGYGRDQATLRGGQGIFLQLIDPAAFGGGQAGFLAATTALVQRCHASRPAPGAAVRLPGERALREKARQLREGLDIDAALDDSLERRARTLGLPGFAR